MEQLPRKIKTLLILVLENIPEYIPGRRAPGLCGMFRSMWFDQLITKSEQNILIKYIYNFRPDDTLECGMFFWQMFQIPPRIRFINELISKL